MAILAHLAAALSLLSVVSAFPSSPLTARACSAPLFPKATYQLQESQPGKTLQTNDFLVSQSAGSSTPDDRVYMLFEFDTTPVGSNGCELVWDLSQQLKFASQTGASQLDVIQVTGQLPQNPTWSNIVGANPSVLNTGTFGSVNAAVNTNTVVNTATCANSGTGLAFVFKLAQWIEQGNTNAKTEFQLSTDSSNTADAFIKSNC